MYQAWNEGAVVGIVGAHVLVVAACNHVFDVVHEVSGHQTQSCCAVVHPQLFSKQGLRTQVRVGNAWVGRAIGSEGVVEAGCAKGFVARAPQGPVVVEGVTSGKTWVQCCCTRVVLFAACRAGPSGRAGDLPLGVAVSIQTCTHRHVQIFQTLKWGEMALSKEACKALLTRSGGGAAQILQGRKAHRWRVKPFLVMGLQLTKVQAQLEVSHRFVETFRINR